MNHTEIPTLPKSLVFGWFQEWADENITWEVGTKHDRYDQLVYVVNLAAKWGAEQALSRHKIEENQP